MFSHHFIELVIFTRWACRSGHWGWTSFLKKAIEFLFDLCSCCLKFWVSKFVIDSKPCILKSYWLSVSKWWICCCRQACEWLLNDAFWRASTITSLLNDANLFRFANCIRNKRCNIEWVVFWNLFWGRLALWNLYWWFFGCWLIVHHTNWFIFFVESSLRQQTVICRILFSGARFSNVSGRRSDSSRLWWRWFITWWVDIGHRYIWLLEDFVLCLVNNFSIHNLSTWLLNVGWLINLELWVGNCILHLCNSGTLEGSSFVIVGVIWSYVFLKSFKLITFTLQVLDHSQSLLDLFVNFIFLSFVSNEIVLDWGLGFLRRGWHSWLLIAETNMALVNFLRGALQFSDHIHIVGFAICNPPLILFCFLLRV